MNDLQSMGAEEHLSAAERLRHNTKLSRKRKHVQCDLDINAIQRVELQALIIAVERGSVKLEMGLSSVVDPAVETLEDVDNEVELDRQSSRSHRKQRNSITTDDIHQYASSIRSNQSYTRRRSNSNSVSKVTRDEIDSDGEDSDPNVWCAQNKRVMRAHKFYKTPPDSLSMTIAWTSIFGCSTSRITCWQ